MGYKEIEELKGKNAAKLTDEYEKKKGFRTDPCVEDQFRLAVDFAENGDFKKNGGTSPKRERNIEMTTVIQKTGQKRTGPKFEHDKGAIASKLYSS